MLSMGWNGNLGLSGDFPSDDGAALALEVELFADCRWKVRYDAGVSFLSDKNFSRGGGAFESCRHVYSVAQHGVVRYLAAADVADERCAGADADADPET